MDYILIGGICFIAGVIIGVLVMSLCAVASLSDAAAARYESEDKHELGE